ncbi:hypothetical protein RALBFv3_11930 [Ralstonia solanacearum]|nr:hypothetical protein RALBFv3_11930 [Ralstonia solanacearum]
MPSIKLGRRIQQRLSGIPLRAVKHLTGVLGTIVSLSVAKQVVAVLLLHFGYPDLLPAIGTLTM